MTYIQSVLQLSIFESTSRFRYVLLTQQERGMLMNTITIKKLWDQFRDQSVETLSTQPGDYQFCVGDPLAPTVIADKTSQNPRSAVMTAEWEFRKVRGGGTVAERYGLAEDILDKVLEYNGEVFFRMRPPASPVIDLEKYEQDMKAYFVSHPGLTDGQKVMRELGHEQFPDDGTMQGMKGNKIQRDLLSKGFLVRAKITHNLDIARSGKFPVYGYGIA